MSAPPHVQDSARSPDAAYAAPGAQHGAPLVVAEMPTTGAPRLPIRHRHPQPPLQLHRHRQQMQAGHLPRKESLLMRRPLLQRAPCGVQQAVAGDAESAACETRSRAAAQALVPPLPGPWQRTPRQEGRMRGASAPWGTRLRAWPGVGRSVLRTQRRTNQPACAVAQTRGAR